MMKSLIILLSCVVSFQIVASQLLQKKDYSQESDFNNKVKNLALNYKTEIQTKEFLNNKIKPTFGGGTFVLQGDNCNEYHPKNCVDVACENLGTFGCKSMDQVTKVANMCSTNYSGDCLDFVCKAQGKWGCDSMEEIREMTGACQANFGSSCVSNVCKVLGKWECDSLDDIKRVGQICANVYDGDCVRAVCEKLGRFGCDSIDEVKTVVQSCKN